MKNDIVNRGDIEIIVNAFYNKVKTDDKIGLFFTDVVHVNWEQHLPRMYDFWDNVLFQTGSYVGNPMQRHRQIHMQQPIQNEHFLHWVKLFHSTIDEFYSGKNAQLLKSRAASIAAVMQVRVNQ